MKTRDKAVAMELCVSQQGCVRGGGGGGLPEQPGQQDQGA